MTPLNAFTQGTPYPGSHGPPWESIPTCTAPHPSAFPRRSMGTRQPGVSEVHFGLYPPSGLLESGPVKPKLNRALTAQLVEKMQQADIHYQDNQAHIRLTLELDYAVTLLWVYEPQPGTVVPLRHFKDGERMIPAVIGMVDEETV